MGDCIKQARAFVQGCHEALNRAEDSCLEDMSGVLTDIQSGAKLNRARAIYRAAQEALQCLEDQDRLPLRLHALSNVVALYESGLVEMETEEELFEEIAPETEVIGNGDQDSADIIPVDFSDIARQNRAIDAMSSAIPYADAAQKQALQKLLSFSDPEMFSNKETCDTEAVLCRDQTIEVKTKPSGRRLALETFIRDIIQSGLSIARQVKVTLSLSYDMDGITVPETQVAEIRRQTETCLSKLIQHLAATTDPEALSHIDISARRSAMVFRTHAAPLSEQTLGSAVGLEAINTKHDARNNELTVTLKFPRLDGTDKLNPTARKIPVEEGITSRLEALLDSTPSEKPDPFQLGAVL